MKANKFAKNDEGVSAVIGVILMVAITVILAAVIAAFVFGMVGNVKKTYNVAATASRSGNTVTVVFNGGPDVDQLAATNPLTVTVTDSAGTGIDPTGTVTALAATGDSVLYDTSSGAAGKVHVVVTAVYKDASSAVILDSYV